MAFRPGFPAIGKAKDSGRDTQIAVDNIRQRIEALESHSSGTADTLTAVTTQQQSDLGNAQRFLQSEIDELSALVGARYATSVGDGVSTQFNIVHGLGTADIEWIMYRVVAPQDTVLVDAERTDMNTLKLRFNNAPASGAYRLIVRTI